MDFLPQAHRRVHNRAWFHVSMRETPQTLTLWKQFWILLKQEPADLYSRRTWDVPKNEKVDANTPTIIYRHHRPKFHQMLLRQLSRIGIEVEYSRRVVEYYDDVSSNEGGVVLDDGLRIQADLVVAADGLGTKSSMLISGGKVEARSSGYAIFRTAFPVERALVDHEVAQRCKMLENGRSVNEVCTSTSAPKLLLLNKMLRSQLIKHVLEYL
jgi:hypothetical protein